MVTGYDKKIEKLRAYNDSVRRRTSLYSDLGKIDNTNTTHSLGALHRPPGPGKKLQKIGFIMFWVPEPTGVSCAIGAPMILAGKFLEKKYNSSSIEDIGHETKSASATLHDFKSSIF